MFKRILEENAALSKTLLPGKKRKTLCKGADRFKYILVAIQRFHPDKCKFSGDVSLRRVKIILFPSIAKKFRPPD